MTTKEKRKYLESIGYTFTRRNSKRQWVKAGNNRQITRCIEFMFERLMKDGV